MKDRLTDIDMRIHFPGQNEVQFLPHGFKAHALFSAHWHSKLPTVSMHTQSIGHGKDTHSFMFCSHLKPVKPFRTFAEEGTRIVDTRSTVLTWEI